MDDIEDLVDAGGARAAPPAAVGAAGRAAAAAGAPGAGAGVPGTARVWLKTFGCAHNTSDSEYMAGQLSEYGYTLVEDADMAAADAWVLNSCTVKGPSQAAIGALVRKGRAAGKALIVAGCLPQGDRRAAELAGASLLGVSQLARVVEATEEALRGNVVELLAKGPLPRLDM
jgi:threonylcarbamoyladenosine tRNA methylthiotransferase CDKAL1